MTNLHTCRHPNLVRTHIRALFQVHMRRRMINTLRMYRRSYTDSNYNSNR